MNLSYDRLQIAADPGLTMLIYTAEPQSKSEENLRVLASWAATEIPANH